jgi:hypothetical protein
MTRDPLADNDNTTLARRKPPSSSDRTSRDRACTLDSGTTNGARARPRSPLAGTQRKGL